MNIKKPKLISRLSNIDLYDTGLLHNKRRLLRAIIGVFNCDNGDGKMLPFDNKLILSNHPTVKYILKRGPFFIGFHNKITNKYLSAVKLKTGESLTKTLLNDPSCTPTINNHEIKWLYENGSWIKEFCTDRKIKEIMFQKGGQEIKFKYKLSGLTVQKTGNKVDIYRGDKKVFSVERSYYMTEGEEFIDWVPITWEKVSDNWIVTYPAPLTNQWIDPTIIFGEGDGQTGITKQARLLVANADNAVGQIRADIRIDGVLGVPTDIMLIRWDMSSLPSNAIVSSAIATITFHSDNQAGAEVIDCREVTTNWGVTLTSGGVAEDPAASGQATYRRAFDFNGVGGDINWSGGGVFSAADYGTILNSEVLPADATPGDQFVFDVTACVQAQIIAGDSNQYGFMWNTQSIRKNMSGLGDLSARRPFLTVDYTLANTDWGFRNYW